MTIMTALVIVALLATVAALVSGIVSMAHGGGFDRRHSHQIMFARVGLQGITLVALLIAFWLAAR
jgi:Hypoxia induced protein conserved region